MQTGDHELFTALRTGDPDAAVTLVDRHHAAIYAFLRRLTGSEADAVELTQRTFIRAWRALPGFAGRSSLRAWLHGIARHAWLDWCRARHRETAPADAWWEACEDSAPGPATRAADADLAAVLYAAVDRLPGELRATVHLHYYHGLTLRETAAAMDTATSTVKHRLRRALRQLRPAVDAPPAPLSETPTPAEA